MKDKIQEIIDSELRKISFGTPQIDQNHGLVVVPAIREIRNPGFKVLSRNLRTSEHGDGYVHICEPGNIGNQSWYHNLCFKNFYDSPILIPQGLTLKGGDQDRMVIVSVFIQAGNINVPVTVNVNVNCIEQGRSKGGHPFTIGGYGIQSIRLRQSVDTLLGAFEQGNYDPDDSQGSVWGDISSLGYGQDSMHRIYKEKEKELEELMQTFPQEKNQIGYIVYYNGVTSFEFYGKRLSSSQHKDILGSYIIHAILNPNGSGQRLSADQVRNITSQLTNVKSISMSSENTGMHDLRFSLSEQGIIGNASLVDENLIHLSATRVMEESYINKSVINSIKNACKQVEIEYEKKVKSAFVPTY